ncbi:MAG TPA: hypothetical protein PLV26_00155 [Lachnospira eligens]|jgi:hypothetical protein|nr:hypothetical protein [Lachnospira eligens]
MSFCKYCGKQLQDGEVCTCQQAQQSAGAAQPQQGFNQQAGQQTYQQAQQGFNQQQASQQMDAVKKAGANAALDYVNVLKGLFTSPVETVSAFVAKANVIMIAILIGGQAIINMLTRLFDMLIANSKAKVTTGSKELDSLLSSYYSSYTNTKPYPAGSIFKNMLLEILLVAVAAAVIALVVMLLAKAFNKANVTYMQGLAVYAITAVLGIPAELLSWVTGLTSVGFIDRISSCVTVFSNVAGYAFVYIAIRALCKDEKKIPLIMAISYVAVNFLTWVLRLMF